MKPPGPFRNGRSQRATTLYRGILLGLAAVGHITSAYGQNGVGGYSVSGNQILDALGNVYYIHGVDRASYEYSHTGDGHFTQADFDNIATWNANTVRIATNQDYLLSDSSCYDPNYLGRLAAAVTTANNDGLNIIFDLRWSDAGMPGICANGRKNMADQRSLTFWQIMADQFRDNPTVFFELYNAPHGTSWDCWLNGCDSWVGMQQLYDTVRNEGFNNLVIVGGLNFAYDLTGVPARRRNGFNIVYATHPYDFPGKQNWPSGFGFLTATDPVIATEFGAFNCTADYVQAALDYFDAPEDVGE